MEEDEIDNFLNNFEETQRKEEAAEAPIKDEQIQDYVTEKLNQLTSISIESIQDVKDLAIASNDGETISALASLIAAGTKQLELLSKFALQKEKLKTNEKMQDKDHAHKEKMLDKKHEQLKELNGGNNPQLPGQMNQQNNFFITASREEIMEKLVGDIKSKVAVQKKTIDIEE
jgi:hypothetical protein